MSSSMPRCAADGSLGKQQVAVLGTTRPFSRWCRATSTARLWRQARHEAAGTVVVAHGIPLSGAAPGQHADVEVAERLGAELARRNVARRRRSARREGLARQVAAVDEEFAAQRVAVALPQRGVQVEQRQLQRQGLRRCQALGRVKAWMP